MTQTITYLEGRHIGTLSIDMNDPDDAMFMEQFKRIPSKNKDYIASLYAREKRRGINRHVGERMQPLSVVKQIDDIDIQKSRLTIDKNSLMDSLRRIDERTKELTQELANDTLKPEERASKELELKSLATEREKIKARADELGIKLATLSAKSSTDGSSPLKIDQLLSIVKKLQEQGTGPDLSYILNEIKSIGMDGGGMKKYISALIHLIDKMFVYTSGKSLRLSKTLEGLDLLNKVIADKRITSNLTQTKAQINEALGNLLKISKVQDDSIRFKAGLDIDADIAEALFKRLFTSLLLAFDFDMKDVNISEINSDFIDHKQVESLLKKIHSAVDNDTHMYTDVPSTPVPKETATSTSERASIIIKLLKEMATAINNTDYGEKRRSVGLNVCAMVLGISKASNVTGYNTLFANKHEELIDAYKSKTTETEYKKGDAAVKMGHKVLNPNSNNAYSNALIATAFNAVQSALKTLNNALSQVKNITVRYNQDNNTLNINGGVMDGVFTYGKPDTGASMNVISVGITKEDLVESLNTTYFRNKPAVSSEEEGEEEINPYEMRVEAEPTREMTITEEEDVPVPTVVDKRKPKKQKVAENFGDGIAGYIRVIDRGNPLPFLRSEQQKMKHRKMRYANY